MSRNKREGYYRGVYYVYDGVKMRKKHVRNLIRRHRCWPLSQ